MTVDNLIDVVVQADIPCARDCWLTAPDGNAYAVVCLLGEVESFWADNRLEAQTLDCSLYLYARDGSDTHAQTIANALAEADEDLFYELKSRSYLQAENLICWQWSVRITDWMSDD